MATKQATLNCGGSGAAASAASRWASGQQKWGRQTLSEAASIHSSRVMIYSIASRLAAVARDYYCHQCVGVTWAFGLGDATLQLQYDCSTGLTSLASEQINCPRARVRLRSLPTPRVLECAPRWSLYFSRESPFVLDIHRLEGAAQPAPLWAGVASRWRARDFNAVLQQQHQH